MRGSQLLQSGPRLNSSPRFGECGRLVIHLLMLPKEEGKLV